MTQHLSPWRLVLGVVVALVGSAISIPLGRYAEADDAPGGVVIAVLIMFGAFFLAVWIAMPRSTVGARK